MSEWRPIETASRGDEVITYYPSLRNNRGNFTHGSMMRIERVPVASHRKPTLWQPKPSEPGEES